MAQQLSPEELANFKKRLISNMIKIQTIAQLLFEKGIITQGEYDVKLKQVQAVMGDVPHYLYSDYNSSIKIKPKENIFT